MNWRSGLARAVVDAVYPPRCLACQELTDAPSGLCAGCWTDISFYSGTVCRYCGVTVSSAGSVDEVACEDCNARPPLWTQGRTAVAYDGIGRKLVMLLKHGDRLDVAPVLAGWMVGVSRELIEPEAIVVPIPLHWRRLLSRKYNQASELARSIADMTGATCLPDALHRIHATPSLKGKTRAERAVILAHSISPNKDQVHRLDGAPVVLVDDVLTTGSTLNAATAACFQAGAASVTVLAVARVARPD